MNESIEICGDTRFSLNSKGSASINMCSSCIDIQKYDDSDVLQPTEEEPNEDELVYEQQIHCDRCEKHDEDATEYRLDVEVSIVDDHGNVLAEIPSFREKVYRQGLGLDIGEVVYFEYNDKGVRHYCSDCKDEMLGIEEDTDESDSFSEKKKKRRNEGLLYLSVGVLLIIGVFLYSLIAALTNIFVPIICLSMLLCIIGLEKLL